MSSNVLYKISVSIKRNPKLSEEEFHKYWTESHGPMVAPWLARHGVIRYNQFHITTKTRTTATEGGVPSEMVGDFDGIAEFWVRNPQDFWGAVQDPFYAEKVQPDEAYLLDQAASRISTGKEVEIIQDSQVLDKKNIWSD